MLLFMSVTGWMRNIPDESVDTVITSPPYWGLRDYGGDGKIWGGDPECNHEWEGYKTK